MCLADLAHVQQELERSRWEQARKIRAHQRELAAKIGHIKVQEKVSPQHPTRAKANPTWAHCTWATHFSPSPPHHIPLLSCSYD